jgi:replicative DNA helicase
MPDQTDRHADQSLESERALLGAMLIDDEAAKYGCQLARPEHLFSEANRRIFSKMLELRQSDRKIDLVTIVEALRTAGELDRVGGAPYVSSLSDGVPIGGYKHLDEYARLVRKGALQRSLIATAQGIISRSLGGVDDPLAILQGALDSLGRLGAEGTIAGDDGVTYRQAALRLLEELEKDDAVKIFTGLEDIDKLTGGFRAGELVVFTADTGVGKTLIAQQTRRRSCQDGRVSLYASCEMTAPHLEGRELATAARVEHWKLRRPERITQDEMKALLEAAVHECDRCRILDGEISLLRIRASAYRMRAKMGLDLVIIDYDELVSVAGVTELEQQRNLAVGCKKLAVDLSVPVILISQLRKTLQGEDRKRPTLQRLYGSGAKAKHASFVIYVDREYVRELKGDETKATICVLKNRDGRVGAVDARFNVQTLRFESTPKTEDEE